MSDQFEQAESRAQQWLLEKRPEINRLQGRLSDAIAEANTVLIIEYRDQIKSICEIGASIVRDAGALNRLAVGGKNVNIPRRSFPTRNPLARVSIGRPREQSSLERLQANIASIRAWLKKNLPPDYFEGFGDGPGDIGSPTPATPFPSEPGAGAAAVPEQSPVERIVSFDTGDDLGAQGTEGKVA